MATNLYQSSRENLLARLAKEFGLVPEALCNVVLEAPRDNRKGDLATNAAMVLAKTLGQNPLQIAEKIAGWLREDEKFARVEAIAPGFVNIVYAESSLFQLVENILTSQAYGRLELARGEKALVEYVSINPTGPIHIGHGRNAVFGDAIANVLEQAGYEVWREYLLNDAGGQIRALVKSLHARYLQLFGGDAEIPAGGYPGEYLIEIAIKLRERDGEKWCDVADEDALLVGLRQFAVDECLALIKADIEIMGIKFDRYFSEFAMHQGQDMQQAVQQLREAGYVYQGTLPPPKGKNIEDYQPVELTLFKATAFGLPEDQAIYNRQGQPTYFGQDIAYHYNKLKRGYGLLCTVLGADQAGAFRPLEKVIEILAGKTGVYHPVAYEMVKVVRDGVPVKLSKRAGNIVLLSEVLTEVGKDAFRFMMLTVKPSTPLVFDLAKAVEKSMENPVFYVQYAHARLASVARLAGDRVGENWAKTGRLQGEVRAVVVQLLRYPLVIEQTAKALEPHRLTVYAQELAAAVHKWYAAERWWDEADPEGSAVRLRVAAAAQKVLADVLRLCGVSAPAMM